MEKKLISALLTNKDNIKYCYGRLRPEMFRDKLCGDIYGFFVQNYQLGLEVNPTEIQYNLQSECTTQEIVAFLKEALNDTILVDSETNSLVKAIMDNYKSRELHELCSKASYQPKDIHNTLVELNKATEEMLKDERPKGISVSKIMDMYKDSFFSEHDEGLRTGLYEIDDILIGLMGGDMTVLAARPAVGKSALATQILEDIALKGKRVGYFNLEMTDKQIIERMVARKSGISLNRIKKATCFLNDEEENYKKAVNIISNLKGLYIFSGSYTATEIKTLCKNQNFDLVVVDYLQIVKPDKVYGNRVSEVGDISKTLKALAMTENVPVIALSQLNRRIGATDEPSMSDLRESGDIEQDASNILLMWNLDEDGRYKAIKVDKNRQGELGKVPLEFKGSTMSFDTINHKTIDQIQKECGTVGKRENVNPFG